MGEAALRSQERRERARRGLEIVFVTDRAACRGPLAETVGRALAGGVSAVMLREKDLPHEDLVALGRDIGSACRAAGALFLVNHDVDAAVAAGADGVQLGFRSVTVGEARAMAGVDVLVGRSTHDRDELDRALSDGADYVTFGPVYDTPSKRGILEPRGIAALADACRVAGDVPVLALGGVTAARAAELRHAGAAGLACIREIAAATDAARSARELRTAWEAAR